MSVAVAEINADESTFYKKYYFVDVHQIERARKKTRTKHSDKFIFNGRKGKTSNMVEKLENYVNNIKFFN